MDGLLSAQILVLEDCARGWVRKEMEGWIVQPFEAICPHARSNGDRYYYYPGGVAVVCSLVVVPTLVDTFTYISGSDCSDYTYFGSSKRQSESALR